MSSTTVTTAARAREASVVDVTETDRAVAEAAITTALRPRLQREIDAVAIAGANYLKADEAKDFAKAEVIRLCGSDRERHDIERRARDAVPIPAEMIGLRMPGKFMSRLLIAYSDGEVTKDLSLDQAPLIDWQSNYDIERAMDDPELGARITKPLNAWFSAKSGAWNSLYNEEQRAAIQAWHDAQDEFSACEAAVNRAVGKLLRVPANTLEEIAAKVRAWGAAWGILKPGGKFATGQMDEFDNEIVLATIGEDLLRGASRSAR